jgi:O-antigen ligase
VRSIIVTLANPVFGVGMGNFHTVSIRELASHNAYTQVAAEMGLAAGLVYILFMVFPLRRLRELEREAFGLKDRAAFYYLAVGMQASLVGYMVCSFFASVAHLWYVYYLVGYSVCLRRLYALKFGDAEKEREAQPAPDAGRAPEAATLPATPL